MIWLKTAMSAIWLSPGTPAFLTEYAPLNTLLRSVPADRMRAMMPLRIISHTWGTPIMMDGWNARMSPTHLRTDASVSFFTRP